MKTAIGYVRTSTDEQSLSIEAQDAKIRAWALAMDVDLVDVVREHASGKTLKRDGLQAVLRRLAKGDAESVVVTKLDRLTRSSRDLWWLVDAKVDFVSVAEQVDTRSPAGRMMLTFMSAIAQWEREIIAERTKDALGQLKHEGRVAGNVPYGKKRVGHEVVDGKPKGGWLEDDEAEQAVLRRARELREAGATLRDVAETLNAEGLKTRKGTAWKHQYVASLVAQGG